MIEEFATVVETRGDIAWVETARRSTCSSCSANKACGTALLSRVVGNKNARIRTLNKLDLKSGDRVIIGIQEQALIRGSLAVYAVPLVTLIAGALLGKWLATYSGTGNELVSVLLGLAGLLIGFLWVKRFTSRISLDSRYQPVILRKV